MIRRWLDGDVPHTLSVFPWSQLPLVKAFTQGKPRDAPEITYKLVRIFKGVTTFTLDIGEAGPGSFHSENHPYNKAEQTK